MKHYFKKSLLFKTTGLIKHGFVLSLVLVFTALSSCSKEEADLGQNEESNLELSDDASSQRGRLWSNARGWDRDFFCTIDRGEPNKGSAYMDFSGASNSNKGNFSMVWSNVSQMVGGKGWSQGWGRDINYNVGYAKGDYKFIGVYGWSTNPISEYYVCEKGPGAVFFREKVGNGSNTKRYWANGSYYKMWKHKRVKKPSPFGEKTFWQVESVRENQGESIGNTKQIRMSTHFYHFENELGSQFGNNLQGSYMVFGAEAYGGSVSGSMNASIW